MALDKHKYVINISGKAGHGKDTFASHLKEYLESQGLVVTVLHFAKAVKEIAKIEFGWDGNKDEKGRQLLIDVGMKYREIDPDIWVKKLIPDIGTYLVDVILIPDTRFPNEISMIQDYCETKGYNHTAVRVNRPAFENKTLTIGQKKDISETSLDNPELFEYYFNCWGIRQNYNYAKVLGDIILKERTIVFDFDNTIVNSSRAFIKTYYEQHGYNTLEESVEKEINKACKAVKNYNFKDVLPNLRDEEIEPIFNSPSFFDNIELKPFKFFGEDCTIVNFINGLIDEGYIVKIATKGGFQNIQLKQRWINTFLPRIKSRNIFYYELSQDIKYSLNAKYILDDDERYLRPNLEFQERMLCLFYNDKTEWNENAFEDKSIHNIKNLNDLYAIL
jgi:hypothetical protein